MKKHIALVISCIAASMGFADLCANPIKQDIATLLTPVWKNPGKTSRRLIGSIFHPIKTTNLLLSAYDKSATLTWVDKQFKQRPTLMAATVAIPTAFVAGIITVLLTSAFTLNVINEYENGKTSTNNLPLNYLTAKKLKKNILKKNHKK